MWGAQPSPPLIGTIPVVSRLGNTLAAIITLKLSEIKLKNYDKSIKKIHVESC